MLVDDPGGTNTPRKKLGEIAIRDTLEGVHFILLAIKEMDRVLEEIKHPLVRLDSSSSECSYADMIHHLEVLKTLPPTNGINEMRTEIELVREQAMKTLMRRGKDRKDG